MWPILGPNENHRVLYNKHQKVHAIKFQSVIALNDLVVNLYRLVEGKYCDNGMLAMYVLLDALRRYSVSPYGHTLRIYGDPAYPLGSYSEHHFEELL